MMFKFFNFQVQLQSCVTAVTPGRTGTVTVAGTASHPAVRLGVTVTRTAKLHWQHCDGATDTVTGRHPGPGQTASDSGREL
eukprot:1812029-Rhodomonas_salina.1